MQVHKRHLNDNYSDLIIERLQNETNNTYELEFLLSSEIEELKKNQDEKELLSIFLLIILMLMHQV